MSSNEMTLFKIDGLDVPIKSVDRYASVEQRLTDNAINRIGPSRYFAKDENGDPVEDWRDVFARVAHNVANAERFFADDEDVGQRRSENWGTRFQHSMEELRFMPNSPTLMNAGMDLQQLSACFVLEPEDDMDDINKTQSDAAAIFKSGGGVGYAFHHLRPKGAIVSSTGGVSSGPISFMELYDTTCGTVKQGGKRRGAQMAIMHAQHPDVGRFAVSKRGEDRFTNFNISIGITDEFKEAVENDEMYTLYNPKQGLTPHDDREAFETVAETIHFYSPDYEDAWNEDFDKPAVGLDGKVVETNFWRDYQDEMSDPEAFDEFRDRIDLEPGEPMELPARFIWQLLIDGAYNNGEPGIFYLDETNREHSFDVEEHPDHYIHATNPCCVTADTRIHTDSGMKKIGDIVNKGPDAVVTDERLGGDHVESSSDAFVSGTGDVYRLSTKEGYSIRLTADHPIRTDEGWVEAQHLDEGDEIHVLSHEGAFGSGGSKHTGEVMGWLVGDGHLKHGEERAVLNFYGNDTQFADEMASNVNEIVRDATGNGNYEIGVSTIERSSSEQGSEQTESRVRSERLYELADEYGLVSEKLQVPDAVFEGSKEQASGFLRALFAADGSVQGTSTNGYSIRLGTTSTELAYDVQELLANFGIYSRVYEERREAGASELPDGRGGTKEYDVQAIHEVVISSSDMVRFRDEIGFLHDRKAECIEEALDSYVHGPRDRTFTATVESVEYDGHETVYDITEPSTHSFVANGIVVHNSEQPLEEFEACNLGHINLSLMLHERAPTFKEFVRQHEDYAEHNTIDKIVNAYLNRAIDDTDFESTVQTGVRFLDNVVTMSNFPLDEIEDEVRCKRKIGLGLMGFHQMLIQMGVQYGSPISFEVARELMRRIDMIATRESHKLAEERGVFYEWEHSKWSDPTEYPEWFEKHAHADPEDWEDGYEMRNHNVTTIAPTGTTSMIANTTGGCEPIYQVAYFKNVGDDIQGDEMLVEFDDYFLKVIEHNDIDVDAVKDEAREKMMNNEFDSVDDLDTVPDDIKDLFVTTQDLDPSQHIDMQAAFQDYCDSGISKTLNMPNDATIDDVDEAFMSALDWGIKGTTVYRDGSRDEQVKTTRIDNRLDGEADGFRHMIQQLDAETAMEVVNQLDTDLGPDPVEKKCDECGSGKLDLSEGCPICMECGYSPCN